MTRVTFLHPDLGIGGAERLAIDAALALKEKGHEVSFVTNHHELENCFPETKDGTIPVTVVGDWLPRHLFGRFFAFFAYIRIMYAAGYIIFSKKCPEIVFCDLISVCIPILRLRIPYVMYYCHYPDQLLSQPGGYERKKNLNLAIKALPKLKLHLGVVRYSKVYLIMMGGYDKRVEENVEHYMELIELADELNVRDKVIFLRSATDIEKFSLLRSCHILLYTPINEHFGIVPIEAMYAGKPVIAHDSGGPMESIVSGYTGYLVDSTATEFASKIAYLITTPDIMQEFGRHGRERCLQKFSFQAFSHQLNHAVENLINDKKLK
ncbi:hypothetical protein KM043_014182 [Ampulex compressa]|nr:hypothetical protein KM043_014182 [Ampulex compressa]